MKRVWIPQPAWSSNVDLRTMEAFGYPKFLLNRSDVPGADPEGAFDTMYHYFHNYEPGDYISALPSDPCGAFLMGLIMGIRGDWKDHINWLRFERAIGPEGERIPLNQGGTGYYTVSRFLVEP